MLKFDFHRSGLVSDYAIRRISLEDSLEIRRFMNWTLDSEQQRARSAERLQEEIRTLLVCRSR